MTLKEFIKDHILVLDGGTGTLLQAAGLPAGMPPEKWNKNNPDEVIKLHQAYFDAGSNAVVTNTFGVNRLKYSSSEIEESVVAAVEHARKAAMLSKGTQEKFVLLDLGPTGRLLSPLGDLDFEDAVSAYVPVVQAGVKAGVDGVLIETMNDCYETKAALLAVKEHCDLPVIVSNAYAKDGRLLNGSTPAVMVAMLEGMGADMIGVNCSFGPSELLPIVKEYLLSSSLPILLKPNAGIPEVAAGKTVFNISAEQFADEMKNAVAIGVRCVGGCCGTNPEYIEKTVDAIKDLKPLPVTKKEKTVVCSATKAVDFDHSPILIGERINPTGKKRLKLALAENDLTYILNEGINQQAEGAHILDVNVGTPDIREEEMLERVVCELQSVCDLPLQIDTSDPIAMERAMRRYIGKPLVNSVNGKKECMDAVFPLVKKYGGVVVALTLDENGIPNTAEERLEIAKRILGYAADYGIGKTDILFDPLALTVSADRDAAYVTLRSIRLIREELGCHTSLGVSNVSFGLPNRNEINRTFFTAALYEGLTAAIMNPYAKEMMWAYHSFRALNRIDQNCLDYIAFSEEHKETASAPKNESEQTLTDAIVKGLKAKSAELTDELLKNFDALEIINQQIIPALDKVGIGFENKTVFLPQLLMSAEAASAAFERIKVFAGQTAKSKNGFRIVLATVKGDIHDIGKNIVRMLLENYGFDVIDLGKDVEPEIILDAVMEHQATLVGLSALMTTTLPYMEETIRLLRAKAPQVKIVVGGAVLTKDYAMKIGADHYATDAMETVRYAESLKR